MSHFVGLMSSNCMEKKPNFSLKKAPETRLFNSAQKKGGLVVNDTERNPDDSDID